MSDSRLAQPLAQQLAQCAVGAAGHREPCELQPEPIRISDGSDGYPPAGRLGGLGQRPGHLFGQSSDDFVDQFFAEFLSGFLAGTLAVDGILRMGRIERGCVLAWRVRQRAPSLYETDFFPETPLPISEEPRVA